MVCNVRQMMLVVLMTLGPLVMLPAAAGAQAGSPLLRVVHASPGAPAIEVHLDGQRLTTAPQFTEATPYVTVPAGSHRVQVFAAGTAAPDRPFFDTNVNLRDGQAYTVVAVDTVTRMEPVVLSDQLTASAADKAYVRLFHASPDAPAVADVAVASGGPVVFRNLAFKAGTDYLAVDAGTYSFELRPAGTLQALATTPSLTLTGGQIYTVFAMGQFVDNTFQVIVVVDSAQSGGVTRPPAAGGGAGAPPTGLASWLLVAGLLGLLVAWRSAVTARRARRS